MRRALLAVAVVLTGNIVQVTMVNPLRLPGGHPDLVGPSYGAVVGFCAGLSVDVLPPADHTVGRLAMAFAVIGYAAGLLEDIEERSVLTTVLVVGAASGSAVVLFSAVGALLGDPRISSATVAHSLVGTVIYDVVLAPFVVPLVSGAARRAEPAGVH